MFLVLSIMQALMVNFMLTGFGNEPGSSCDRCVHAASCGPEGNSEQCTCPWC